MAELAPTLSLAQQYHQAGDLDRAAALYRQILAADPAHAEALHLLGVIAHQRGDQNQAIACIQRSLTANPRNPVAHFNLASALAAQGRWNEAAASYRTALVLKPGFSQAHNNLGHLLMEQGHLKEAVDHFQQAIRLDPRHGRAHNNLGTAFRQLGRLNEALTCCQQAVGLMPQSAEAHYNLAAVYGAQGSADNAAASCGRALSLKPDFAEAYSSLSVVFSDQGKAEQAIECLHKAIRLKPTAWAEIALATRLPAIYQSMTDLQNWRDRLTGQLRKLKDRHVVCDLNDEKAHNLFYLAYQGCNDRDIHRQAAELYRAPNDVAARPRSAPRRDGKISIGLLSSFFKDHTIGHWMRGLIAKLSRKEFAVTVLSIGRHDDAIAAFCKEHADTFVEVPTHLPSARRLIAEQQLDVLFYADIGMDPVTYTLAFSRLAPVQCVTLGHPVTTGVPTIDYFISCADMETDQAPQHYTEKLILLKNPPIYYYRPQPRLPLDGRDAFGLSNTDHLYVCPQTLFKFHPEFDALLGGILRGDPRGILVLSQGAVGHWEQLLRQRFEKSIPDVAQRIRFLPKMDYQRYLSLLAACDVQLDTLHFGGGRTTLDGLAVGTPIVTLPTQMLRGRITVAFYRQMGVLDCVASDSDDYVRRALRLGMDSDYRESVRRKILDANGVLFENTEGGRELEGFFRQVANS